MPVGSSEKQESAKKKARVDTDESVNTPVTDDHTVPKPVDASKLTSPKELKLTGKSPNAAASTTPAAALDQMSVIKAFSPTSPVSARSPGTDDSGEYPLWRLSAGKLPLTCSS
jgi:hypothetical protein